MHAYQDIMCSAMGNPDAKTKHDPSSDACEHKRHYRCIPCRVKYSHHKCDYNTTCRYCAENKFKCEYPRVSGSGRRMKLPIQSETASATAADMTEQTQEAPAPLRPETEAGQGLCAPLLQPSYTIHETDGSAGWTESFPKTAAELSGHWQSANAAPADTFLPPMNLPEMPSANTWYAYGTGGRVARFSWGLRFEYPDGSQASYAWPEDKSATTGPSSTRTLIKGRVLACYSPPGSTVL